MNALPIVLPILVQMLREYLSKNQGLNTVSGGFLGAFLALLGVAFAQTTQVDQLITWLLNQGIYGVYAGAVVAGARTAYAVYSGSLKEAVDERKAGM